MKILLLTNHLNIGGLTTYTASIAGELTRRGHTIYIGSGGGELSGKIPGVTYIDLGLTTKCEFGFKVWRGVSRAAKIVKKEKIDLIHAQTRVTSVLGRMTGILCKIPFITTAHGFYRPRFARFLFPCWGKNVIAISEPVYCHLVEDFHIEPERVKRIYNGTDFNRFSRPVSADKQKEFRKKHHIPDNLPVIGTVSRLSPVKGHEFLLEAFYYLLQKRKALLLLVGDGPKADYFRKIIDDFDLAESVRMVSSTDTPEIPISVMDIFVLPSLQEGLSLSILEAQAGGKPVIATNVGGISQIILDGKTGCLVPSKDVQALLEKMELLVSDRNLANRLGEAGKERVRVKFNLERMIQEVESLYQEVLHRK